MSTRRLLALTMLASLLAPAALAQETMWPDGAYDPYVHSPILFVIVVDVEDTRRMSAFVEETRRAFQYWQAGGNGALRWNASFQEIATVEEAHLLFVITDDPNACGGGREAGCGAPPNGQRPGIALVKATRSDGVAWRADSFGQVARHELGHALGLRHSDSPTDIMYPSLHLTGPVHRSDGGWMSYAPHVATFVFGGAIVVGLLRRRGADKAGAVVEEPGCIGGPYHDFEKDEDGSQACRLCGRGR